MTTRSVAAVEQALLDKGMERDEKHHKMFRTHSSVADPPLVIKSSGFRDVGAFGSVHCLV